MGTRETRTLLPSPWKDLNAVMRAPPSLTHQFPKVPSPNSIILGLRVLTYGFLSVTVPISDHVPFTHNALTSAPFIALRKRAKLLGFLGLLSQLFSLSMWLPQRRGLLCPFPVCIHSARNRADHLFIFF